MSIWSDMEDRGIGNKVKTEDSVPIHLYTSEESITKEYYQLRYLGRINGHDRNAFFPKGLGELYQVQRDFKLNGLSIQQGALIIGYENKNYVNNYYLYSHKASMIK